MKSNINVDTKTFVRFWFVVIAFVGAIWLLSMALPALIILGTSFFLALVLNSPVSFIARKLPKISRAGATAIAYFLVLTILIAVIILVIPPIIEQTAKFVQTIPSMVQDAINQWKGLGDLISRYNLQDQVNAALLSLEKGAATWASNFGQNILGAIGSVFGFFTASILVIVLTFLMLVEGPSWKKKFYSLYSDDSRMRRHEAVVEKMYNVVNGYVTGQLIISGIGALAASFTVFILSLIFPEIPSSLAMPTLAVTFILSLIPMFGASIAGVLITSLIALNNIPAAIIYLIFFFIYQQVENNFIQPRIQSKRIALSALIVIGSVTIGLYTFGIVGGLLAIPVAGSIRVLIDQYFNSKHHKTKEA